MEVEPLPEELRGDKTRFKQILINLVKNATKFTKQGMVKLRAAYNRDEGKIMVSVIDTGVGISAEEMPNLFKMFGKLNRTADQNSEGLGFGLMICDSIVKNYNGSIEVFSAGKYKGSSFTFTMEMEECGATMTLGLDEVRDL